MEAIEKQYDKLNKALTKDISEIQESQKTLIDKSTGKVFNDKKYKEKFKATEKTLNDYTDFLGNATEKQAKKLNKIWQKDDFKYAQQHLVDALRNGEDISLDNITKQFPDLVDACNEAGISVEELYNELDALASQEGAATVLEKSFESLKSQTTSSLQGFDTLTKAMQEQQSQGYLTNETLDSLRLQYSNIGTP